MLKKITPDEFDIAKIDWYTNNKTCSRFQMQMCSDHALKSEVNTTRIYNLESNEIVSYCSLCYRSFDKYFDQDIKDKYFRLVPYKWLFATVLKS